MSSAGKKLTDKFLIELAKREEPNRTGKLAVINLNEILNSFNTDEIRVFIVSCLRRSARNNRILTLN